MTSKTAQLIKEIKEYYKVSDLSELNETKWNDISGWDEKWNDKLTENFIEKYLDKINWSWISGNQKLSESFIEKHIREIKWKYISRKQNISLAFIEKHNDKIDYPVLLENKHLKLPEQIKKLEEHPEWTDVLLKIFSASEKEIHDKKLELYYSELKPVLKEKMTNKNYWKSYINYLKNKYPDKNIFQVKIFDKIIEISDIFNMDRSRLLDIINKSFSKKNKLINIEQ